MLSFYFLIISNFYKSNKNLDFNFQLITPMLVGLKSPRPPSCTQSYHRGLNHSRVKKEKKIII